MVNVRVYGTEEKATDTIDMYLGIAHAQEGLPVEVSIQRGKDKFITHLSFEEAAQLHEKLGEARKGAVQS